MKLELVRTTRTINSTIGELSIDGHFFCNTLEPTDRGLTSEMDLHQVEAIKVFAKTAIPTGTYNVVYAFSPKHQRKVPLMVDVKGFQGIEMHIGNYPKDTEGCTLCGKRTTFPDKIVESTITCNQLWKMFEDADARNEHSQITIR